MFKTKFPVNPRILKICLLKRVTDQEDKNGIPVTAMVTKVVRSMLGAHLLQMAWLQGNNTPLK